MLMRGDSQRDDAALTRGEADQWARRFRKIGFSPVTVHQIAAGDYYLRCNFPYDPALLPEDLSRNFSSRGGYQNYDPVRWIRTRFDAKAEYAKFRVVWVGMGSKPIRVPKQREDEISYESSIVFAGRIAYDTDDWPDTQRHTDWKLYLREHQATQQDPPEPGVSVEALSGQNEKRFACLCCGYYTLSRQPSGTHNICPVCFWQDDSVNFEFLEYSSGANGISLIEARRSFATLGYAKERSKQYTRPPRPEEFSPA